MSSILTEEHLEGFQITPNESNEGCQGVRSGSPHYSYAVGIVEYLGNLGEVKYPISINCNILKSVLHYAIL